MKKRWLTIPAAWSAVLQSDGGPKMYVFATVVGIIIGALGGWIVDRQRRIDQEENEKGIDL